MYGRSSAFQVSNCKYFTSADPPFLHGNHYAVGLVLNGLTGQRGSRLDGPEIAAVHGGQNVGG